MKRELHRHSTRREIFVALLTIAVAAALFWLPTDGSAQQEPNRQLVQTNAQHTGKTGRIALVIGNGAYTNAPPLKNPPNDARDMAATLKQLGFTVASAIDADQRTMKRLIREFGQQLKGGGQGLFYYAGHGVQMRGRNYLIPASAEIASETDVEDQGVDLNLVLGLMDEAQNGLNIVILDACRNNPFTRSFRSAGSGLAQVDAPTGTLIAYATSPGRVAGDGQGRNGLYTSELLNQMLVQGISVEEMFKRVRAGVQKQTNGQQVPWESSSLVGNFYFAAPAGTSNSADTGTRLAIDPAAFELSYWDSIKNSTDANDFKGYLEKYPSGQFVTLAKNRITSIEAASKPVESRSSATSSATELAFWDSIKNSTSADDYRAYLGKYPNGDFVVLANNRLKSMEAAAKAKGKTFDIDWEVTPNSYKTARIVIQDSRFRFEREQQDIRSEAQLRANVAFYNEDIETSFNRLNSWYKDAWNCSAFNASKTEEAFIREVRPNAEALGAGHPTYRLRFKSPVEATEALTEIQRICQLGATKGSSNPLEGTTWKGASPGGDKHYQVQFLPNGNVIWNLKWNNYGETRGSWRQEGNTITLNLDGYLKPVIMTLNGETMNGSWSGGQYKFTLTKVQ